MADNWYNSGTRPTKSTPTTSIIDSPHQSTPKLYSWTESLTTSIISVKGIRSKTSSDSEHKHDKTVQSEYVKYDEMKMIHIIADSVKRYVRIIIEAWRPCKKKHRVTIKMQSQNRQSDNQIWKNISTPKDLRSDKKLKKKTNQLERNIGISDSELSSSDSLKKGFKKQIWHVTSSSPKRK
jgi:hypothetical protein